MDLPKISLGWLLRFLMIISITYLVTGYLVIAGEDKQQQIAYENQEYGNINPENETNVDEPEQGWLDSINSFFGTIMDGIIMLYKIMSFDLLGMPTEVRIVMSLIFGCIDLVIILGIIPYLVALAEIIIRFMDAIIPF